VHDPETARLLALIAELEQDPSWPWPPMDLVQSDNERNAGNETSC
jgi:hypothetical protein